MCLNIVSVFSFLGAGGYLLEETVICSRRRFQVPGNEDGDHERVDGDNSCHNYRNE
jgi:hypothetical protein